MFSFFTLLVYLSGYVFLVFVAICLACGLYYLAELAEEYTTFTKKVIFYTIWAVLVIHFLLWVLDGFPTLCILVGAGSHLFYFKLLRNFPFIEFSSASFLGSIVCFLVSHYAWIKHFMGATSVAVSQVMGFFLLMVWTVPFGFFISLSVNESVLPTSGGGGMPLPMPIPGEVVAPDISRPKPRKVNRLLSLFDFLRRKKDEFMPSRVTKSV